MARLCACPSRHTLSPKRSLVLVTAPNIYEHHGSRWCAAIERFPSSQKRSGSILPIPMLFILMGEKK